MKVLPIFELSQPEYGFPERQQINLIAGQHCLYFTIRSQKTRFLIVRKSKCFRLGTAHIWCFAVWKRNSWNSANLPRCRTALAIYESLQAWKRDSWASANRSPLMSALPISECFATWIRESWASANHPPWLTTLPISELFAAWIRDISVSANDPHSWTSLPIFYDSYPEHQQIDLLVGWHCPYERFEPENTIREK